MAQPPAIDYTNKDYASLRRGMLELAQYRLPEWTDLSPADVGVTLVDLFAYMGDIILYYQDRLASELFPQTALEPRNVLQLLRLIGYELKPPSASSTSLDLTFNVPGPGVATTFTIATGQQFATKAATGPVVVFEYTLPPLSLDLAAAPFTTTTDGKRLYRGLPVRQVRTRPLEILGTSTNVPNQSFELQQTPVVLDTLQVEVNEGAGFVAWDRRDNLLYHVDDTGRTILPSPDSHEYYVQFDELGIASVVMGDGLYGAIPRGQIRARYATSDGAIGNVAANTIAEARTSIPNLKSVTNPAPAVGGEDRESIDHAVRFAPLAFRSQARAVTLTDFISIAHQAGGVSKVRAHSKGWNTVELVVAPTGNVLASPDSLLKQRLVRFFEDKRMVGTFVVIRDPIPAPVDVTLDVIPSYNYDPESVRLSVEKSINDLLAYANVDFGRPLYLSKVYEAVETIPGVFALTVRRFARRDATAMPVLKPVIYRIADRVDPSPVGFQITSSGRIDIDDVELPFLGGFIIDMQEAAR